MKDVYTIGFTKKDARTFFGLLKEAGVRQLLDVRLNNVSQLAGFAKRDDLRFFLREICQAEYLHLPDLAPTKKILDDYKKGDITWHKYEEQFLELMLKRRIEKDLSEKLFENACLLCSEHEPHFCHRRLVVEYLKSHGGFNLSVRHLF